MLPKEFYQNWNIDFNEIYEFGNLIQYMICNYENRKNIFELFNIIYELKIRNEKLINDNNFNFGFFNKFDLDKIEEEDCNNSIKNNDNGFITPSNKDKKCKINFEDFMDID